MGGNGKADLGKKWEWEFCDDMGMGGNGNGSDAMGVGGSGNLKTHSRTPLQHRVRWCVTSLQIIQYHRHWYQSKARVRLPISLRSRLTSIISEVEKPFSPLLSTPFSFEALARGSVEPRCAKWLSKTGLPDGENCMILQLVLTQYQRVTDRHGRTDMPSLPTAAKSRYSIAEGDIINS